MLPHVYLETTIVSYLAARPSRDVVVLAHRELTAEWWAMRRPSFEIHVSELVSARAAAATRTDPTLWRAS